MTAAEYLAQVSAAVRAVPIPAEVMTRESWEYVLPKMTADGRPCRTLRFHIEAYDRPADPEPDAVVDA